MADSLAATTDHQRELLSLAEPIETTEKTCYRLALDDVQRILGLRDLPHRELLDENTWLVGGMLNRWLSGGLQGHAPITADFDMFYRTRDALAESLERMLSSGFRLERYALRRRLLFRRIQVDSEQLSGERQTRGFCRALANDERLVVLRIISPEGHHMQPHGFWAATVPHPSGLLRRIDFSVCQFASDGESLFMGPHALGDLWARRLRLERIHFRTLLRFRKYRSRGFRPTPGTWLRLPLVLPVNLTNWLSTSVTGRPW